MAQLAQLVLQDRLAQRGLLEVMDPPDLLDLQVLLGPPDLPDLQDLQVLQAQT